MGKIGLLNRKKKEIKVNLPRSRERAAIKKAKKVCPPPDLSAVKEEKNIPCLKIFFFSLTVLSKLDLVPDLGPALGQALPHVPLVASLLPAAAPIQCRVSPLQ